MSYQHTWDDEMVYSDADLDAMAEERWDDEHPHCEGGPHRLCTLEDCGCGLPPAKEHPEDKGLRFCPSCLVVALEDEDTQTGTDPGTHAGGQR